MGGAKPAPSPGRPDHIGLTSSEGSATLSPPGGRPAVPYAGAGRAFREEPPVRWAGGRVLDMVRRPLASASQLQAAPSGSGGAGVEFGVEAGVASKGGSATVIAQFERVRSRLAADEILNAPRLGSALKGDPAHRAPSLLSLEQVEAGRVFGIRGGDGV